MSLSAMKFQELLARAKANAAARRAQEEVDAASSLEEVMQSRGVEEVDLSIALAGMQGRVGPSSTEEDKEEVVSSLLDSLTRSLGLQRSEQRSERSEQETIYTVPAVTNTTPTSPTEETQEEVEPEKRVREIGVARSVILNDKQQLFNDTVLSGSDVVLIGSAGTGKTTSMRTVTRNLIDGASLPKIDTSTKTLLMGAPGAAILSFTRKAVNNIRHAVVDELKPHTMTIHKLLEFGPEFYEIEDPNNPGYYKTTMRFVPSRGRFNPLPTTLTFLAFEESSMISTELYELLQDAMPHKHQEIFLGDIQQLPPIFGQAILGFKMLELKVVELTEVYRQARESPIIDLAWKILAGDANVFSPKTSSVQLKGKSRITVPALDALSRSVVLEDGTESEVKFQIWQKPLSVDYACLTAIKQFCAWEAQGYYHAEEDIILCPFNKSVGTTEINKGISDYLGKKRGAEVHEVISGFQKHYLAVGDRVLYDKEDGFITSIRKNGKYLGKNPLPPHVQLDRWGHLDTTALTDADKLSLIHASASSSEVDLEAIEAFMASAADGGEDRVVAASHVVEIRYSYADELDPPIVLESAGEINNLLGGYCITVHKFQGSEAERVFILLHHTHAVMVQRELLYTAVTRAKKFLHIICEKDTFYKGIRSQKIKGDSIEEKAEWFKGKRIERESEKQKQHEMQLTEEEGK